LRHVWTKVLDIGIGKLRFLLIEFGLTLNVVTNVNLFIVEQHAVYELEGILGRFGSFVVNETVSPGLAMFVSCNFARQYVSESGEGIVKGLVIDRRIQFFNKNVAVTGLPKRMITLGPHNAADERSQKVEI
jgi:hypothetical protein